MGTLSRFTAHVYPCDTLENRWAGSKVPFYFLEALQKFNKAKVAQNTKNISQVKTIPLIIEARKVNYI